MIKYISFISSSLLLRVMWQQLILPFLLIKDKIYLIPANDNYKIQSFKSNEIRIQGIPNEIVPTERII